MSADLKPPLSATETAAAKSTVCVTGASGYVASHIIHRLLAAGHTVHGTARNPAKAAFLANLPGASTRLKLFKAELGEPGSFDVAVVGCDYVIHVASPVLVQVAKGKEHELVIKPAVDGVKNVIAAVNKAPTVKRVIYTSSGAAVSSDAPNKRADYVWTEADWSTTWDPMQEPYAFSKTEAEKLAFELAKAQDRWDLVTVVPLFVLGPPLAKVAAGESTKGIGLLLNGGLWPAYPALMFALVDVRDVAVAHMEALFRKEANGRYIACSGVSFDYPEVTAIVRHSEAIPAKYKKKLPLFRAPIWLTWLLAPMLGLDRHFVKRHFGRRELFDNSRSVKELGMTYIPLEETIIETAEGLIKLGLV